MRKIVPLLTAALAVLGADPAAALTPKRFCDGQAFELPRYSRDLVADTVRNRLDEPDRTIIASAFGRCDDPGAKRWAVCGSARERSTFGTIYKTIPFFGWYEPDAPRFRLEATGDTAKALCKRHVGSRG